LTGLEDLSLSNTQVTDVGLRHLARLTWLRRLNLAHTAVTNDAVAELQRALPGCRIEQ
jgi:internalin A